MSVSLQYLRAACVYSLLAVVPASAIPPDYNGGPARITIGEHETSLYVDPIAGLTTRRHKAPPRAAAPLGSTLVFVQKKPLGAHVEWDGGEEVWSDQFTSVLECPLRERGSVNVVSRVIRRGLSIAENRCVIDVVEIRVSEIIVQDVQATIASLQIDPNDVNADTFAYFIGESISGVHRLDTIDTETPRGLGRSAKSETTNPVRYAVSINRTVHLKATTDPPGFEPWLEWQTGTETPRLARTIRASFSEVGTHRIVVGPPDSARAVEFDAYSVEIVGHSGADKWVRDGELVTFQAAANPPGYDRFITWLSSTKYGAGDPVSGTGPTFTVRFDETWGEHPSHGNFQWLGVKADHTVFNQDQKTRESCIVGGCCTTCGGGGQETYGDAIAVNQDLHIWDKNCAANGQQMSAS